MKEKEIELNNNLECLLVKIRNYEIETEKTNQSLKEFENEKNKIREKYQKKKSMLM